MLMLGHLNQNSQDGMEQHRHGKEIDPGCDICKYTHQYKNIVDCLLQMLALIAVAKEKILHLSLFMGFAKAICILK